MPARRRSPVRLVAAFTLVCAAPLVAVAATGLTDERPGGDRVETATGGGSGAGAGSSTGDADAGPPGTGTADLGTTTTSRSAAASGKTHAPKPPAPSRRPGTPVPGGTTSSPGTSGSSPTTGAGGGGGAAPPTSVPPSVATVEQVVTLVNTARDKVSPACPALRVDDHLTYAAQAHSDDMVAHKYFSHDTPDGVSFADRIKAAGYPRPGGENIAEGQTSAQQVMSAWMASARHRANILNCSFTAIGVGVNTVGWAWTQDFGY